MSSCEKCWRDSHGGFGDQVERYQQFLLERNCTPEQQAGSDAGECPACNRNTLHQVTREPMCGCAEASNLRHQEALISDG